ncbi:HTH domain-containing protein [Candidatus Sulfurimonas marisnigri]|uniref:HTH domain-containing protein n=1 Tax=Candidatus Sulfurimonas marisnigri TaxID=2740405 RepID=A0A7S7M239_9BACT|nr:HTH domain-containing protein [Candidatus Sulfurimonas marisnigri]QOY55696.1 HTH domain-containing protein [Candidatus Sulfurimonas marisnigri]
MATSNFIGRKRMITEYLKALTMDNKTDKLAIRFLYIITQLNLGKKLTPKELALKFDVTERIIQKDIITN